MVTYLLGALIGIVTGCAVSARYLRQEIAANIGPKLRRIQVQLDHLGAEIDLALATQRADAAARALRSPIPPPDDANH